MSKYKHYITNIFYYYCYYKSSLFFKNFYLSIVAVLCVNTRGKQMSLTALKDRNSGWYNLTTTSKVVKLLIKDRLVCTCCTISKKLCLFWIWFLCVCQAEGWTPIELLDKILAPLTTKNCFCNFSVRCDRYFYTLYLTSVSRKEMAAKAKDQPYL